MLTPQVAACPNNRQFLLSGRHGRQRACLASSVACLWASAEGLAIRRVSFDGLLWAKEQNGVAC